MSVSDCTSPDRLRGGNPVQRRCYAMLEREGIFRLLQPFSPLLAGTVPIGIDVEGSDLDIVCRIDSTEDFAAFAVRHFGGYRNFESYERDTRTIVCRFVCDDIPIEIFASDVEPFESNAWRHMIAEYKVLESAGDELRRAVVRLKRRGLKTEPAFARLLGLEGDPYEAMLRVGGMSDAEITELAAGRSMVKSE